MDVGGVGCCGAYFDAAAPVAYLDAAAPLLGDCQLLLGCCCGCCACAGCSQNGVSANLPDPQPVPDIPEGGGRVVDGGGLGTLPAYPPLPREGGGGVGLGVGAFFFFFFLDPGALG